MSLFGTDGIRGVAHRHPVTPQFFLRLGFHAGMRLRTEGRSGPVVMARDPRRSGSMLAAAAASGLASAGCEVLDAGVLPTPAVSLLVRQLGGALGVVLSASHNPAEDNGIKFFGPGGGKLDPAEEAALEEALEEDPAEGQTSIPGTHVGEVRAYPEGFDRYVRAAVDHARAAGLDLSGVRVGVDAAHGAASFTTPAVLRALGAEVVSLACDPDGRNINTDCGATATAKVSAAVPALGLDLGIAHDGDADRVMLVDARGRVLDGDDMLFLLSDPAEGKRPAKVVGTVMSNEGLARALGERGVQLLRAPVGDKHVQARMQAEGAPFGAEPSGHVIVASVGPTGDGLLAGLEVLRAAPPATLGERAAGWERFPQALLGVRVVRKPPLDEVEGWAEALGDAEAALGDEGRVLVRYSGTEPKARVMVEARDEDLAGRLAAMLAARLEAALGAA